jgi:3'-phosphoadenosine 5'-phosphosulfate sulfotransferase (PAPS reductase)/FAD synthetase
VKNVLLCSGGRTSGLMLKRQLENIPDYRQTWLTIFCNTGREMPQTLDFVHEMESRWGVPITWLEYHRVPAYSIPAGIFPTPRRNLNLAKAAASGEDTHWFKQVDYDTASRNGEPFDELLNWMTVLPNVVTRGCSMQLKIRTAMRYLFSMGLKEYISNIGIRIDEAHRATQILSNCDPFEHPEFPLIRNGVSLEEVTGFWQQNDFDLQLKSYQGNCDLCFLKAKWKRVLMAQQNPDKLQWWLDWESKKALKSNGRGINFRLGEPYILIEKLAASPSEKILAQIVAETEPDIACTCAEKAFGQLELNEI